MFYHKIPCNNSGQYDNRSDSGSATATATITFKQEICIISFILDPDTYIFFPPCISISNAKKIHTTTGKRKVFTRLIIVFFISSPERINLPYPSFLILPPLPHQNLLKQVHLTLSMNRIHHMLSSLFSFHLPLQNM